MGIDGHTRLAAVVANPIKHSLSPFIHNRSFEETSTNGVYLAFEIEEDRLFEVLENIRILNMYGINLSMPFKGPAAALVDELTPVAELVGAVNTVALTPEGRLLGHTTDGLGFFKGLSDYQVEGSQITVLGGGGAGLAIIAQAALLGAKKVRVFNRRSERFIPLRDKLSEIAQKTGSELELYDLADRGALEEAIASSSLLVNTTSVGMDGVTMPLPEGIKLPKDLLLADIIYEPRETPLLRLGRAQGVQTINGLPMLVHQAAESYELWTGKKMPVELIGRELGEKIYGTES